MDERTETVTVPTELNRADPFWDFAVLASAALFVIWCVEHGIPWPWLVPLLVPLAAWTLTGEGAADIPYVGSIAAGLRSKFGLRRAHEWLLAYSHYTKVAIYPVWRARCETSFRSCRRRTTDWKARLAARMPWKPSRVFSWAFRIPSRSSRRHES